MKIYETEGFPNPLRVRIALAEKGATDKVVFVPVDVMGGEHRTSDFRAKNPDATVPVLELDDGTCIAQCNAITEYLDGVFDGIVGPAPVTAPSGSISYQFISTSILSAVFGSFGVQDSDTFTITPEPVTAPVTGFEFYNTVSASQTPPTQHAPNVVGMQVRALR